MNMKVLIAPVSYPGPLSAATGARRVRAGRGFALLITLTLLALLVLVAVSFAALTRVEVQVAANQQALAQARQHALMAVNISIGQLQKYAGPDARISAQAAAATSDDGDFVVQTEPVKDHGGLSSTTFSGATVASALAGPRAASGTGSSSHTGAGCRGGRNPVRAPPPRRH